MKRKLVYFTLGIIFIFSSWAVLRPGLFKIHDFTHGARIAEMTRALQDGHFPVRWSQNFGFGFGMPLYQFYGPLPFYLGGLVYWLSDNLPLSIKALFVLSNALTLVGAYLLGRKLFKNSWAGVAVSAALTLAPYRALNLYIRGAISETWGIMAVPWILWAVLKTIKGERRGWFWLVVSLATLFLSHNLSVIMFAPVITIFTLIAVLKEQLAKNNFEWKNAISTLLPVVGSLILALAASTFYLIPAFFEKNLTKVDHYILSDYFDFHLHFLYLRQFFRSFWGFGGSQWGPDDPISFFLGWGQIVAIVVSFFLMTAVTVRRLRAKISHNQYFNKMLIPIFTLVVIVFSALMTTQKSLWLWENIDFLKYIQFPWRFIVVMIVGLSLLAGWVTQEIVKLKLKRWLVALMVTSLLFSLLANVIYFRPQFFIADADNVYYADAQRIQTEMSGILPDYIPATMPTNVEPASNLVLNDFKPDQIEVLSNRTQEKLIKTNFNEPTDLLLAIAAYPHWRGWLGQQPIPVINSDGRLQVTVPEGQHLLAFKLQPTRLRFMSDLLSLTAFLIMLLLLFKQWQKDQ